MQEETQLTVYYNSACPVCDAGICYQRRLMQEQNIEWIDIHTQGQQLDGLGLELEAVREQLHVRTSDGKMLVGDLAFASLWQRTPGQKTYAELVQKTHFLIKPLYQILAKCLYRWNRCRGRW